MLDYDGKIAGISIHDGYFSYVTAYPQNSGLYVQSAGGFELASASSEQFQPLMGCRCIYGINRSEFHRKRLYLADDLAASDPDQFLWELSRSSAENINNYLYSLLKLQPVDKGIHVECLSINKASFRQIGQMFEQHNLTLDKMIFEPEAIRQTVKSFLTDDRAAFLHVERNTIALQLFRRSHLIAMEFLQPGDLNDEKALTCLTEEIGTLLMATFGGRPLRRKLSLTLCGDSVRKAITRVMVSLLPYDFTLNELPFDRISHDSSDLDHQQLHQYFCPLALCYAYNGSRKCASSPEQSAVLS